MKPEQLLLVCKIIDHSISNNGKTQKRKKQQLAVEKISVTFNLTPIAINQIKDQIEFLYNNGKKLTIKIIIAF